MVELVCVDVDGVENAEPEAHAAARHAAGRVDRGGLAGALELAMRRAGARPPRTPAA